MIQRRTLGSVVFSLFGLLLVPAALTAEPVTVTGGYLEVIGRIGSMELTGERGFSLTANIDTFTASVGFNECGSPTSCTPGSLMSIDAVWTGFEIRSGVLTFEGETYPVREIGGASAGVEFEGSFVAPPIVSSAVVTTPFTLLPNLMGPGSGSSGFSLPFPGGSFPLDGSGIATITLSQYFERGSEGTTFFNSWKVDSVRYDFSAAEPVPEPATMLLSGLGIAGIARRVRRRRA